MRIVMVTNSFTPLTCGVTRSIELFVAEFRRLEHRVLVIAPAFRGSPAQEHDVLRLPAIQSFNGSDFSVRIPIPGLLTGVLSDFRPEVVHAHQPFLLGDAAVRISAARDIPLVFTHHTMYEQYTHYVPGDSPAMQRFVVDLATGYANLCDRVIAPSQSIATVLRERGVHTPVDVIPTGVETERFSRGSGSGVRRSRGIPDEAFVVGYVGRLAPEKNLDFLSKGVGRFLQQHASAHFLVVGDGPTAETIRDAAAGNSQAERVHLTGCLQGQELIDAYHALDVFAFASQSETQGVVLAEAMAAGVPVVAVDAPGVRDVVIDRQNGRLLPREDLGAFAEALDWVRRRSADERQRLEREAFRTAEQLSMPRCAARALALYGQAVRQRSARAEAGEESAWDVAVRRLEAEWELWSNRAHAAGAALQDATPAPPRRPTRRLPLRKRRIRR